MKIGVLAQYLDTRQDIGDILRSLALQHEITIYVRPTDLVKIKSLRDLKIAVITIPAFSGQEKILILVWQYLYLLLGQIPKSSYNYYMTEHIKLLNSDIKPFQRFLHLSLLTLSRLPIKFMRYDQFLNGLLLIRKEAEFDPEIDFFLCFTQIYHDWTFASILQQKKPVWVYVYSWDHPCKMKTFSKKVNYLVWHEGIKADTADLQEINPTKIHVLGATQFAYIHDFLSSKPTSQRSPPVHSPYIYLGCATGYANLAKQEIRYCALIAEHMLENLPHWTLVIKPYPFLKNTALYDHLGCLPNVVIHQKAVGYDDSRYQKFNKINQARAFFHFGTTMGYEAGYFKTPSFLLDFADPKKDKLLNGFIHQYQNDKYLNAGEGYNVIRSDAELIEVMKHLAHENTDDYNNDKIRQTMELDSFDGITRKLITLIEAGCRNEAYEVNL